MKKGVVYYFYMQTWRIRLLVLLMWAVAFWLALGLLSYHQSDSSLWFYYDGSPIISNKAGNWGAQIAALLFFLFGMAALWIVPFLFLLGYQVLFYGSFYKMYDQLLGWLLLLCVSSALGAWYQVAVIVTGFLPGGAFGYGLVGLFSFLDSLLVGLMLHAVFFSALIIATRCYVIYFTVSVIRFFYYCLPFFFSIAYAFFSLVKRFLRLFFGWIGWLFYGVFFPDDELALSDDTRLEKNEPPVQQELTVASDHLVVTKNDQSGIQPSAGLFESKSYQLPPASFFNVKDFSRDELGMQTKRHQQLSDILVEKLARFDIHGQVVSIKAGPVVTLFEYQPSIDTKVSKILALEDDLALALQATAIRIRAPIPGKSVVGFEVANQIRNPVFFSTIVLSTEWQKTSALLPLILGVDINGAKIVVDLVAMPHVLIAGATGSGKSVALNAMIISLLLKKTPEQLRLILIDPKRIEFALYAHIPHLLMPIVDDPQSAGSVLRWAVQEMERRYRILAAHEVRNIYDYEKLYDHRVDIERLPFIVIVIDELSDLMMTTGKEIEIRIARLAQMARAAGIHLIVATQRPSVDVITGIIKVNFPTRIAFKVSSKIDSRIILDTQGADKLIGKGDMLYLDAGSTIMRVHGAYISDEERTAVVRFIREQKSVEYVHFEKTQNESQLEENDHQLYQDVLVFLKSLDEVSISLIQRKFRIGYNRAARIIEKLEQEGSVIASEGGKTRKVVR